MKWAELNRRERDVLIHEKVMGKTEPEICEFDPSMTVMTSGSEPDSFDWHCYKCGAHGKVTRDGYYQHQKAIPHYTTSMDDVWQVVRHMNKPLEEFEETRFDRYQAFIDALQKLVGSDMFFDLFYCDKDCDHLTPERICIAALRAVSVDAEV